MKYCLGFLHVPGYIQAFEALKQLFAHDLESLIAVI